MSPIRSYREYYENVEDFFSGLSKLSAASFKEDYTQGFQRVRFYPQLLSAALRPDIHEHQPREQRRRAFEYELAFRDSLLKPRESGVLILIGGLGAGKSTGWRYVSALLREKTSQLFKTTRCPCGICRRVPVLVDCLDISERDTAEDTATQVLKRIRLRTYEQLIVEWLLSHAVEPAEIEAIDPNYLVLRRLLISNDLMETYASDSEENIDLRFKELTLETPLLQLPASIELISNLTQEFREAVTGAIDERLREIGESLALSTRFMTALMRLFLRKCKESSPLSFFVVDNLDQLPNRHITYLVNRLYDISVGVPGLSIVVPLRPSSISVSGFKGKLDYRYHFGPSNFEMILKRIERRLLVKPLHELVGERGVAPDGPFKYPATAEEVKVLLLAAYLYSRILETGFNREMDDVQPRISIHDDHRWVARMLVPRGIFDQLSKTLGALVGICSRYALEEMQRFFFNIYREPGFLLELVRALDLGDLQIGARRVLPRLVDALISVEGGPELVERRLNLFQPRSVANNYDWPTLVKLRILQILSVSKREKVGSLVSRLRNYGIPAPSTLTYLNELHEKERLLVWFSDNRNLRLSEESLGYQVVISEHGLAYYSHLLGDFEYCWYCATEVLRRSYPRTQINFDTKLAEYTNLVERVGKTEWKQIAFRRCASMTLAEGEHSYEVREMLALTMLYRGLQRILESFQAIASVGTISPSYYDLLTDRLRKLSQLTQEWQGRYQALWGSTGYLEQYSDDLSECQKVISELSSASVLDEVTQREIERLDGSWRRTQRGMRPASLAAREFGESLLSKYLRIIGPRIRGGRKFAASLSRGGKGRTPIGSSWWKFFEARDELRARLKATVPTFDETLKGLRGLERKLEIVRERLSMAEGTPRGVRVWFDHEQSAVQQFIRKMESNRYSVSGWKGSFAEGERPELLWMTECKENCNRILEVYRELADRLDIQSAGQFDIQWM